MVAIHLVYNKKREAVSKNSKKIRPIFLSVKLAALSSELSALEVTKLPSGVLVVRTTTIQLPSEPIPAPVNLASSRLPEY
jgi:hypothetical protein